MSESSESSKASESSESSNATGLAVAAEARRPFGRDLWILTGGFFLYSLGNSLYFLLPRYIKGTGASDFIVGLVMGATGFLSIPAAPLVGSLTAPGAGAARRRAFLLGGALLAGVTSLGFLVAGTSPAALLALRAVQGAAFACTNTAAMGLAADLAPPAQRARVLGLTGVAGLLTSALGPLVAEELVHVARFEGLFVAAAVLGGAAVVALSAVRDPTTRPAPAMPVPLPSESHAVRPETPAQKAASVFSTAAAGVGFAAALNFVPVLGELRGLGRVSVFYAAFTAAAITVRLGLGGLADRHGRRAVVVPSMTLMAISVAGLALARGPWTLLLAGAGLGLGHGLLYPALYAQIIDRSPLATRNRSVGIFTASFGLGFNGGSIGFGALLGATGPLWSYPAVALLMLMGLGVYVRFVSTDGPRPKAAPE